MNEITAAWKALANAKQNTAQDMLSYIIIRAIRAKSNDKLEVAKNLIYKSFSPVVNGTKLACNCNNIPFHNVDMQITTMVAMTRFSKVPLFGFSLLTDEEKAQYKALVNQLWRENLDDKYYVYAFVRNDLEPVQKAIQLGHVCMVLGQNVKSDWGKDANHLHFCVFDGGSSEKELISKMNLKYRICQFFEPNVKGSRLGVTAIAYFPMRRSFALRKKLFVNEKLLEM